MWSRGMIPASGAGGPGFKSRLSPDFYYFLIVINLKFTFADLHLKVPTAHRRYSSCGVVIVVFISVAIAVVVVAGDETIVAVVVASWDLNGVIAYYDGDWQLEHSLILNFVSALLMNEQNSM